MAAQRIKSITLYKIKIPFRMKFAHSRSSRHETENVIVKTVLEDGVAGYGECVPRPYVTGETPKSAFAFLKNFDYSHFARGFEDYNELVSVFEDESFIPEKDHASARCALELSFLDAFGKSLGFSLDDIARRVLSANLYKENKRVYYSVVMSMADVESFKKSALKYKLFGFKQVKIKCGTDEEQDRSVVAAARDVFGPKVDLRVDANGAWNLEKALEMCRYFDKFGITSLEEPLVVNERNKLPELTLKSPVPIMLDEAMCSLDDAKKRVNERACSLFNIRISKCGGFIRSCQIAKLASENNIGYQLGCQVGETAILSAAGREFATNVAGIRYLEGSYDPFLLKSNVARNVSFGIAGKAKKLTGMGLGVAVKSKKVEQFASEIYQIGL